MHPRIAVASLPSIALLFAVSTPLWAQSPAQAATPAPRDQAAVTVVQNSLLAMGGGPAIGQIQNCIAQGSYSATAGSWLTNGDFTWKNSSGRFRYDNPDSQGRSVLVSGKGSPMVSTGGKTETLHAHVTATMFPPHLVGQVLAQRFLNASYSFRFIGNETLKSHSVVHVQTNFVGDKDSASISPQEWYFDAVSSLPVRVTYLLPTSTNALATRTGAIDFADYRNVGGVLVPYQMSFYLDGQPGGAATLTSVTFNTSINSADFDSPAVGGLEQPVLGVVSQGVVPVVGRVAAKLTSITVPLWSRGNTSRLCRRVVLLFEIQENRSRFGAKKKDFRTVRPSDDRVLKSAARRAKQEFHSRTYPFALCVPLVSFLIDLSGPSAQPLQFGKSSFVASVILDKTFHQDPVLRPETPEGGLDSTTFYCLTTADPLKLDVTGRGFLLCRVGTAHKHN
jgi:hypothetical protein